MKKIIAILISLVFIIGTGSAVFEENVGMKDDAQASVDRPLLNQIKAFTNEHITPLYTVITGIEDFLGG